MISSLTAEFWRLLEISEYFKPDDIDIMRSAVENAVYLYSYYIELKLLGGKIIKYFSQPKCSKEALSIYKALV